MHISKRKLESIYKKKGLTLKELLHKAGVSKTAYYSLLYKETILPSSIRDIALVLNVKPSAFLEEVSPHETKIRKLIKIMDKILKKNPELNRENVWHTLLLLQERPLDRLNRGLLRGRKFNFHR
jgi:transcriptional regulator with XRE-family HTH domain